MAFHGMRMERDGEWPTSLGPETRSEEERQNQRDVDGEKYDEQGRLLIEVEPDIVVADFPTSVLPPPRGKRTGGSDDSRQEKWAEKDLPSSFSSCVSSLSCLCGSHFWTKFGNLFPA